MEVLPVTTLFFWNFCFSLRTSYKELICCTNNPNAHICTFCKCWSFIRGCFSPVIILNYGIMNNMNSFCYSFIDVLIEFINSVIPLHFFYKQLHFLLQHQLNYGSMNFQSESFPRSSRQRRSYQKFSENMQQIYSRTPMPKCDFKLLCNVIEITLQHGCSPVNLLHISRTPFPWNMSVWPLLFSSSCLLNSIQPLVAEFNFCHLID